MSQLDDVVLRAALATARELEPTDCEVARALARTRTLRADARRRALAVALSAAALLGSGVYAVPVTRAAIEDVFASFAGWMDDGSDAPGRAVTDSDGTPAWLADMGAGAVPRVVAANGGVELFAIRRDGNKLAFGLGASVAIEDTIDAWRKTLAEREVVVLGPGSFDRAPLNTNQQRPLFGVTARSVTRVELQYTSGPPLSADGLNGGFVLLADTTRGLRQIVAYDAKGSEVERADVSSIDLRVCRDDRGCPPGQLRP